MWKISDYAVVTFRVSATRRVVLLLFALGRGRDRPAALHIEDRLVEFDHHLQAADAVEEPVVAFSVDIGGERGQDPTGLD